VGGLREPFPDSSITDRAGRDCDRTHYDAVAFCQNWMFCTVNAIMFDMKDYDDDANIQLKTFAVRMGLRNTIYYVLVPLLVVGLISLLTFASYRGFGITTIALNMIPFVCLLIVAFHCKGGKAFYFISL
jgi:4-hydroxybenzoate polyprenyltransferase